MSGIHAFPVPPGKGTSIGLYELTARLLGELDSMDKGTPEWRFKCRTLRDTVEGHVEMEERQLFPLAQRILDDEEAGIA